MKRTVFYHQELQAGAKMRQAQGWETPDHFGDPRRLRAPGRAGQRRGVRLGLHGRDRVPGPRALALVQKAS